MILNSTIDEAKEILVKTAEPKKVILFGSYARGNAREDSDLDFLVITEGSSINRFSMATKLRRLLSPLKIPADIIVHDISTILEWADVPGTLIYSIMHEGAVLYEKQERCSFNKEQHDKEKAEKYNFTDLAGKLVWKGDAVSEQRKLRREWR